MPIIKITSTDLKANELMEPGWYPAKIVSFLVEPNSAKDGINYIPVVRFPSGKEIQHYGFSSKKPGMLEPLMLAVGIVVDHNKDYDINTDDFIGKTVKAKVMNDTYQGRLNNKIEDWAHIDKDTAPAF